MPHSGGALDGEALGALPRSRKPARSAITALLGVLLLVNLAASLYQLPLNRVVERRLCHEFYSQHDPSRLRPDGTVDEELCKVDTVQQGLGRIQGAMETIWIVGGTQPSPLCCLALFPGIGGH